MPLRLQETTLVRVHLFERPVSNMVQHKLTPGLGMDNDNFNQIAGNVSTVVDLLEARGISWSQYQVSALGVVIG